MKKKTIDAIRNLALEYESEDLEVAYELMSIAHKERPDGPFIKKKFLKYQQLLNNNSEAKLKLSQSVADGDIAIIPIGFRCNTAEKITELLGVRQASLPFNSGFFSPKSIASVLSNPKIDLKHNDQGLTHRVCIKNENHRDNLNGLGIKFEISDYDHINSIATHPDLENINRYLDSTFGFYTLDVKHQFVLAHYNWHKFSHPSKSKGIVDPDKNLENINETLNKRIDRMFNLCRKAKHIFFVYGEFQKFNYIQIGSEFHHLNDFSHLEKVIKSTFDKPYSIVDLSNQNDIDKVLTFV